ncbi:hypothetical protein YW7DRAFT_02871 [Streptomyces sp. AmelKG-E11A]|nr:hypothetical protein YW7DRAFT_02871 [Streptomyces sp. AmelKG-E11A]
MLTQIHPSLERVLGPRLQHPAVLTLLERFGSPAQIRRAGRRRLVTLLRPKAPRMAERLIVSRPVTGTLGCVPTGSAPNLDAPARHRSRSRASERAALGLNGRA